MTKEGYPETEEELQKCMGSAVWVLKNLCTINTPAGVKKFRPNLVQRIILAIYWWANNILKSRQHGVSTLWVLFYGVKILLEDNRVAGIIDLKENSACKKLGMFKLCYEKMDDPKIHPEKWEMVNATGGRAVVEMWQIGAAIKNSVQMIKGNKAPNPKELVFSNGSRYYADTGFRGDTLHFGLFTEFGKIALKYPEKAREVVDGAENAMHEGSIGVYETTMEGGEGTLAGALSKQAMDNSRDTKDLTRLDQLFMFFGWFLDPKNRLDPEETARTMAFLEKRPEIWTTSGAWNWKKYFYGDDYREPGVIARLAEGDGVDAMILEALGLEGIELDYAQIAWYCKKRERQGWSMLKEHPTFAEEAFQAPVKGAIYAEHLLKALSDERIEDFNPHGGKMVHTTWDIGSSENTVTWYWQKLGHEWLCIDCDHGLDMTYEERVGRMLRKPYNYGVHALPHDAAAQKIGKLTTKQVLEEAGLKNVKTIPVIASVDLRIQGVWGMFPNIRFRKKETEQGRKMLAGYRYKIDEKTDTPTGDIEKNDSVHYADAFGQIYEADRASLFPDEPAGSKKKKKPKQNKGAGY